MKKFVTPRFTLGRWLSLLLLVALLLPAHVQAQSTACAADVVIQAGDTLSALATRYYGDLMAYTAIVAATNAKAATDASYAKIADPGAISVGWKLCLPGPLNSQGAASAPSRPVTPALPTAIPTPEAPRDYEALRIENMRKGTYPGSAITIEQTLAPGVNYSRYYVSYRSEGLKIYALMTVPNGTKPAMGWPVVVFNHGYIPPEVYRTTERYVAYVDGFARNGYLVFRSDYRGHASSEGQADGAYGSPDYTVDVLNAVAALQKYPDADPNRIGMWGHSMGGYITLRDMVINKVVKVGVIWAGVVSSYPDMLNKWRRPVPATIPQRSRRWRAEMISKYGTPEENPIWWNAISANSYLADLSGPLQLHYGTNDEEVPPEFSETLAQQVKAAGKSVEIYSYEGDNHNLSNNFTTAMTRSIAFFDRYLKNGQP